MNHIKPFESFGYSLGQKEIKAIKVYGNIQSS